MRRYLDDELAGARLTPADARAKRRAAGLRRMDDVIRGDGSSGAIDPRLLDGVRRGDALTAGASSSRR